MSINLLHCRHKKHQYVIFFVTTMLTDPYNEKQMYAYVGCLVQYLFLYLSGFLRYWSSTSLLIYVFFIKTYTFLDTLRACACVCIKKLLSNCYQFNFRWYPDVSENEPKIKKAHRAYEDIRQSIQQLQYFRKTLFK